MAGMHRLPPPTRPLPHHPGRFAAVLDDGLSQISIEDVRHWKQVAVSAPSLLHAATRFNILF
jgi:hypothetical protein